MKLDKITIKNFRCFETLTLELHPKLTVLTALNGGGKTTLIDALRIAMWPFVKGFDLGSQTGKSATIQIEDVRIKQLKNSMEPQVPAIVEATGCWPSQSPNETYIWSQRREKVKLRTNTLADKQTKNLTKHAEKIQGIIRNGSCDEDAQGLSLPLLVYLGTGRLWYQGRYTSEVDDGELDASSQSRLWAYQNCLTATSSYKQFEHWFGSVFKSYRELQIEELEGKLSDHQLLDEYKNAIDVVQNAINSLTKNETGWYDLQYRSSQNQQLVMKHDDHGYVPLSQLSDGLRNMVVMISDIAFRCYKLNPHLGCKAAKMAEGIVLIDEVDMFLHPSWQQRVISALQSAFPSIQFVVTTHSPQVLTTVPAECIRIIDNGEVYIAAPGTKGAESSRLLKRIFGVDSRPQTDENTLLLKAYEKLVYEDKWASDEAKAQRVKLDEIFAGEEPKLTELDLYIENREWELGCEED
ncbi:TPA: AAA family ATPase [Vibrio vulnificus]|nr:AAA family ATPase [Vibrio vulnificus]HDY8062501.1 AAA family ATPase [Vibrio vulnificus]HDY8081553.1 AAA family ATPase [Vibrio vulnificus]HDY8192472.1 AAA family ATPase [Vibrio vulnificus]